MKLLQFFQRRRITAPVARERLQVLLAHERVAVGQSNLVTILREEILAVIVKHVAVDRDKVHFKMDHGQSMSTLEVDIELPTPFEQRLSVKPAA
jgi:cell division topological specificity factor